MSCHKRQKTYFLKKCYAGRLENRLGFEYFHSLHILEMGLDNPKKSVHLEEHKEKIEVYHHYSHKNAHRNGE